MQRTLDKIEELKELPEHERRAVAKTWASPEESVVTLAAERVALAPDVGAEKFTVWLAYGLPPASTSVACNW